MKNQNPSRRLLPMAVAVGAMFALSACGDDDDAAVVQSDSETTLLSESVAAADGGTFESGPFKVVVPAGALSADSTVTVRAVSDPGSLPDRFDGTSDAYEVSFSDGATLSEPMKIEIAVNAVPTHPAIGGVAQKTDDGWRPALGNFFRGSTSTAVGLTETAGVFTAVNRSLQRDEGDDVAAGREVFMNRTFGNETFFGGAVGLHEVLNSLSPTDAVGAGVQVDLTKVPQPVVDVLTGTDFSAKQAALADPAVTRALLKADAVIGVRTFYADPQSDIATSAGITCALCHVNAESTEFELASGVMTALPIGAPRFDGVPNASMDAGAILSLTPFAQDAGAATVNLLASWGPGSFDVRALPDNPLEDNVNNPTQVPPLWNFVDLTEQGYAFNWDGLFKSQEEPDNALASQAEAVYDLVMHANGAFGTPSGTFDPELSITPPPALVNALVQAETESPGNDVGPANELRAVQAWQRSIVSPAPGAFDESLAEQGFDLFYGKAGCAGCHASPEFTGQVVTGRITLSPPMGGLSGGIKTPGLRGISSTAPYFHDGSAADLTAVMDVYSGRIVPMLSDREKTALVEYMKTL